MGNPWGRRGGRPFRLRSMRRNRKRELLRFGAVTKSLVACVCVAGLANTHHLARIGRWAEQCADAGLASVHFVNVLALCVVGAQ